MHFPAPDLPPKPSAEPPAMVRSMTREDVLWNRPIFKAPPLDLNVRPFDAAILTEEFRRVGLGHR